MTRHLYCTFIAHSPLRPISNQHLHITARNKNEKRAKYACCVESSSGIRVPRRALLAGASAIIVNGIPHAFASETRVADYGKLLGRGEKERLERVLTSLEETSGLRVRVLTVTIGVSAPNIFPQSTTDVLLVADTRGGNLLYTRVAESVYSVLPRSFWIELPNRFGTQFFVRENGSDGAIFAAINAIAACSVPGGRICANVPGVSSDQLGVSVVSAALAGAIFGAAARTDGEKFNAPFVLLFAPIWSIFLVSFGMGPVLTRLQGVLHMESVAVAFSFILVAASIWFWVPRGLGPPPNSKPET